MDKRTTRRLILAAIASIAAGIITAYAAPVAAHDESVADRLASRTFHAFRSACHVDWDDAPVARAMFAIRQ